MALADFGGPGAFDPGQGGDDVGVGQDILVDRHVGFVIGTG